MKLEINYKKKTGKFTKTCGFHKQYATQQPINGLKKKSKKKLKNTLRQMKMKTQYTKIYGIQKK